VKRFPTADEIAKAHAELGIDPKVDPCCDRCGAPVTTGVMALICPYEKRCEFWCEEVETLAEMMGDARP
jgi:hypothetical protein